MDPSWVCLLISCYSAYFSVASPACSPKSCPSRPTWRGVIRGKTGPTVGTHLWARGNVHACGSLFCFFLILYFVVTFSLTWNQPWFFQLWRRRTLLWHLGRPTIYVFHSAMLQVNSWSSWSTRQLLKATWSQTTGDLRWLIQQKWRFDEIWSTKLVSVSHHQFKRWWVNIKVKYPASEIKQISQRKLS